MHKRIVECFVWDILVAVDMIMENTKDIQSSDDLVRDAILFSAMCRELEIIGEAMKHIVYSSEYAEVVLKEWRDVIDFRNVVAHEYFGLNQEEVFSIIKVSVPSLKKQILVFAKEHIERNLLKEAFEYVSQDLLGQFREDSVALLKKSLSDLL